MWYEYALLYSLLFLKFIYTIANTVLLKNISKRKGLKIPDWVVRK